MRDFRYLPGADLLVRVEAFYDWQEARRAIGVWPLGRSTEQGAFSRCTARTDEGALFDRRQFRQPGLSQPQLASRDPRDRDRDDARLRRPQRRFARAGRQHLAVARARETRSPSSWATSMSRLFPTGWAAGFGVIKGLVRAEGPYGHGRAQPRLPPGRRAGGDAQHPSVPPQSGRQRARKAGQDPRKRTPKNGILIVTESLFSMDSDTPDIRRCRSWRTNSAPRWWSMSRTISATSARPAAGIIEAQDMLGKVDVVMGSFSKTFASNGGFVAARGRSDEGISALLQLAQHLLERAVARQRGDRRQGLRHRRARTKARCCAAS